MSTVRRRIVAAALAATATVGALAGCTTEPGSTEAFCLEVRKVPSLEAALTRFSEADPDVLAERIDQARDAYDALADAAPSEIDAETDDVVALVDEVLTAVEDHPTDPEAAADQLRDAMADHPDAAASQAAVSEFAKTECDVTLDPTLPEGGTGN